MFQLARPAFKLGFHILFSVALLAPFRCAGQQQPDGSTGPPPPPSKHVLGIIPNFRTTPTLAEYHPINTKDKFKIGMQDTFDRGTIALGAAFAGISMAQDSNPSFGQGVKGYAHYFGTAYSDFAIGNFMTEAVFPTMLRQDPRYFRLGSGSPWSRLRHACGQVFWTRTDSGRYQFNFSEFGGNATAVAVSMAYYPENRHASDAISKLGLQVGLDMASNVLKEFWPSHLRKPRAQPAKTP